MARFIVAKSENGNTYLQIKVEVGDELTAQEAAIWQMREIDRSLDSIRMHLNNIENGIDSLQP